MKTLHRFKKVIRNTFCSIICASFFVVSSITPAKADSNVLTSQYTHTNYGEYWVQYGYSSTTFDYQIGPFGVSAPVNSGSWLEFHYTFKREYNGYITFTLNSNQSFALNTCVFSVVGGTLSSSPNMTNNTSTRSLQIQFNNATEVVFRIMKQESFLAVSSSTFGTGCSVSITSSNFNTEPDLTDVMTKLTNIDYYIPGMSTNLSNIYNQMQMVNQTLGQPDIYGSLTEAVELIANFVGTDLDDYLYSIKSCLIDSNNVPYLDTVNDTLSSINTFINNIDTNTDDIESSLASILTAIQNIQSHDYTSNLTTITQRLSSIYSSVNSIYNTLVTSLHTNLNIPMWQIPAWAWARSLSYTSGPNGTYTNNSYTGAIYTHINISLSNNTYDQSRSFKVNLNEPYIIVWGSTVQMQHGGGVLFGHPVYSITPSSGSISDYITYIDGTGLISVPGYYINYVMFDMHDKIPGSYGLNSTVSIEFEFNQDFNMQAIYIGTIHNMPDDIAAMCHLELDNTYTTLLQQIANGIGNISIQQVNENNTNINNYNNYQTQINNVENNYYNQFNQIETNIENNNTFDFTGLTNDGVSVYNNLFTNIYSIPLVKWPVLITLLGLVIVIILG